MKIRYLAGVYKPDVLLTVNVDINEYELDGNLLLLFNPLLRNGEELFDLNNFTLMGARFKTLSLFKIFQYVLLMLAGMVSAANTVNEIVKGGARNVFTAIMLFASIGFTVFSGFNLKTAIERRLYGGIFSKDVEIYFQTEEEKDNIGSYLAKNKQQRRK